jgi:hypothetical protein
MQVSGILVITFFVVAYLNQFGLRHFPEPEEFSWLLSLVYFFVVVALAFLASEVIFQTIKIIEIIACKIMPQQFYKIGSVFGFFAISFISFGLLGFYKSGPLEVVNDTWFIAVGTYGLFMIRLHIEARKKIMAGK